MSEVHIRVDDVIDEYMSGGDIAKENANTSKSPSGLLLSVGGKALKEHNLSELKEAGFQRLVELHNRGGVHIHDLSLGKYVAYCASHSLPNLLNDGLDSSIRSAPAKHLSSAVNHIINYIGTCSNDFAGAQAFNDVDLYLAPYAYKTYLDYKERGCNRDIAFRLARRDIYQNIQSMVYHLNYNSRWGSQPPFTNISLAITVPNDMKNQLALVAGKPLVDFYNLEEDSVQVSNRTYNDLWEWQQLVAEAILDILIQGDADGKSFTFPVLTLQVSEGFFEHPLMDKICQLTAKFGYPFFENHLNGVSGGKKTKQGDTRSMCCRLNLDLEEVTKHTGGLFGGADNTGSIQVITLCLPYLAMKSKHENEGFFSILSDLMDEVKEEHLWKRKIVEKQFYDGFYHLARQNFSRGFKTFFTTFGFIGLWETVEILTNSKGSFLNEKGMQLAEEILQFMANRCNKYMEETGTLFNLEATPAESACYKLAKKSKEELPHIPHRGTKEAPYFTNSHHLPVEYQDQLDLVFTTQTRLQTIPTGGTVQHFQVGEELSKEEVKSAVQTICQTSIPYFSINLHFSWCPIHGVFPGRYSTCPYEHTNEDIIWIKEHYPNYLLEE